MAIFYPAVLLVMITLSATIASFCFVFAQKVLRKSLTNLLTIPGRGRSSSMDQDESDEYRARQPSDTGTLWDFVKMTIKSK